MGIRAQVRELKERIGFGAVQKEGVLDRAEAVTGIAVFRCVGSSLMDDPFGPRFRRYAQCAPRIASGPIPREEKASRFGDNRLLRNGSFHVFPTMLRPETAL